MQKKSILEKLPGGDALFDKTGDELMSAAKAMGATPDDMAELIENQDTRTYDQKMLQEMELLTDVLIKKFAPEQEEKIRGSREAAKAAVSKIPINPDKIEDALDLIGFTLGELKLGKEVIDAGLEIGDTGDAMIAAKAKVYTTEDDMVSPPSGYGTRTLSGPEGAIQLNNKDTVIAGTNLFDKSSIDNASLENTMMQVGLMIVAAIKSGGTIGPNLEYRYSK